MVVEGVWRGGVVVGWWWAYPSVNILHQVDAPSRALPQEAEDLEVVKFNLRVKNVTDLARTAVVRLSAGHFDARIGDLADTARTLAEYCKRKKKSFIR